MLIEKIGSKCPGCGGQLKRIRIDKSSIPDYKCEKCGAEYWGHINKNMRNIHGQLKNGDSIRRELSHDEINTLPIIESINNLKK